MARKFQVVTGTPELLRVVADNVRMADVEELWASDKITPSDALQNASKWSTTFVALADDVPICAFGVVPYSILGSFGAPWMVGTNALDGCAKDFIRHCKTDLKGFFGEWERLYNVVDARNTKAIRWLAWLGFQIQPAVPYGPFKMMFHPFTMEP